jgi:hypothetical protein
VIGFQPRHRDLHAGSGDARPLRSGGLRLLLLRLRLRLWLRLLMSCQREGERQEHSKTGHQSSNSNRQPGKRHSAEDNRQANVRGG